MSEKKHNNFFNSLLSKRVNIKKVLKVIALLVIALIAFPFIRMFFLYGSPNSFFVRFVGRDMKNFVDASTIKNQIKLDNKYLLLYHQKNYKNDSSSLKLKFSDNKEIEIISGHVGYDIDYGLVLPHIKSVFYTFKDLRSQGHNNTYLRLFNYSRYQITDEIDLFQDIEYSWSSEFLSVTGLSYLDNKICLHYLIGSSKLGSFDHKTKCKQYSIQSNKLVPIEKNSASCKEACKGVHSKNIFTGQSFPLDTKNFLTLFVVSPKSDYLPANYKPKYNGLYIHDSKLNINKRISLDKPFITESVFWLDRGRFVLTGNTLYSTDGYGKTKLIENGKIIAIAEDI